MVDAKTGKSAVKPASALPPKAAAKSSPVKTSSAAKSPSTPAKPPVAKNAVPGPAPKPAPAKAATTPPVVATPAKSVSPPPAAAAPKPASAATSPVLAAKAAKAVDASPKPVETVAQVAAKVAEKVAAAPIAAAKTITPPPAANPIQKGLSAMAQTVTPQAFVPTPENIQALFGDMSTRAKAAMENSAKLAEEMGEFTKGNVEALLTSSRVAAKGAETLGQEAAAYSKKSLETATAAFKGFAAAKSPTELFKLQSDYARSSFDAAVAESSKFSEAMMKLFGEITQPISSRVAIAAEKIKTPAF